MCYVILKYIKILNMIIKDMFAVVMHNRKIFSFASRQARLFLDRVGHFAASFETQRAFVPFFFILIAGLFFSPKVIADTMGLSVNPPLFQIKTLTPADAKCSFILENTGLGLVNVRIIYKLFQSDNTDGQVVYLTDKDQIPGKDKQILRYVQVIDNGTSIHALTLGPRQRKELQLWITVPRNEPSSDYYFSVVFIESPAQEDFGSNGTQAQDSILQTNEAVATNVLLSIGSTKNTDVSLENFSAPFYLESGPVPFTVRVHNGGSKFVSPVGLLLITNMFGQTVGRVVIPPTNILADSSRDLTDTAQAESTGSSPHGMPVVIWPEKILLGPYSANLSLAVTKSGPIYTKTIHFIAFPSGLLSGIILTAFIIFLLILRVKKYIEK
jgi:hypothetical protein